LEEPSDSFTFKFDLHPDTMGKPGLGIFQGRRKSSSNVMDDVVDAAPAPAAASPTTEQNSFRVLNRNDIDKVRQEQTTKKGHNKEKTSFASRFAFGTGNKARNQSVDEDSPSSSKRYVAFAAGDIVRV
jgi:hypothetical protein